MQVLSLLVGLSLVITGLVMIHIPTALIVAGSLFLALSWGSYRQKQETLSKEAEQ